MQRSFTVLGLVLVSGLALTGCPEKKAEKEEAASPDIPAAADQAGADDKQVEEAEDAEEKAEEKADEKKEDAEEGGW